MSNITTSVSEVISVIVPTCHRNDMLALCLERLAPGTQTLDASRYEVIVTDDGRDSTAQQMLAEKFPWARWVEGPKRGPAANRNSGAKHAQGAWIAFTDDDCLPEKGWLEAYYQQIQQHPEYSVFEGKTLTPTFTSPFQDMPRNETGGCLWSCNLCVRRQLFEEMEGFDADFSHFCEDIDFRERLYGRGYSFPFVADAVVFHPERITTRGKKYAALCCGWFQLYYKTKKTGAYTPRFLIHLLKTLIKSPLIWGLKSETFRYIGCLAEEFFYIGKNGSKWEKKYKDRYKECTIPYRKDVINCMIH
jgi:GT2 family glycosyltransferase